MSGRDSEESAAADAALIREHDLTYHEVAYPMQIVIGVVGICRAQHCFMRFEEVESLEDSDGVKRTPASRRGCSSSDAHRLLIHHLHLPRPERRLNAIKSHNR